MNAALILLLLAGALPPDAKGVAVMARGDDGVDPKTVAQVEALAWKAFHAQAPDRLATLPEDSEVGKARTAGAEALARARQQAEELDTEAADASAQEALTALRSALVTPADAQALARVHRTLMILNLWNSNEEAATDHARRALALDPALTMENSNASPDEEAFWNKLKSQQEALPRGSLEVVSNPAGARVILDGRTVGVTPLKLGEVAPGPHQVRLMMPLRTTLVMETQVPSGGVAQVQGELADTPDAKAAQQALQQDALNPPRGAWMEKLTKAGADHAVIVVVAGSNEKPLLSAHLVQLKDGKRIRRVERASTPETLSADVEKLIKDVLDTAAGPGVPGGAAMLPGGAVIASEDAKGGGFPVIPVIAAAVVLPVVALVIGAGVGGVVGAVGGYLVGQRDGAAQQAQAQAEAAAAHRAEQRRETARRVATQGY